MLGSNDQYSYVFRPYLVSMTAIHTNKSTQISLKLAGKPGFELKLRDLNK